MYNYSDNGPFHKAGLYSIHEKTLVYFWIISLSGYLLRPAGCFSSPGSQTIHARRGLSQCHYRFVECIKKRSGEPGNTKGPGFYLLPATELQRFSRIGKKTDRTQ